MFRGTKVVLRPRQESDIPILHRELYEDVPGRVRADGRPWTPRPLEHSPFKLRPLDEDNLRVAVFTVADPTTDEPFGSTLLWNIDQYNRSAHIGMALIPAARGRGLATEVLELLAGYAFQVLGLNRLAIETLSDNEPMIRTALAAGYTREGTLRQAGWVNGQLCDEAIFGLLAAEWQPAR